MASARLSPYWCSPGANIRVPPVRSIGTHRHISWLEYDAALFSASDLAQPQNQATSRFLQMTRMLNRCFVQSGILVVLVTRQLLASISPAIDKGGNL